MLLRAPGPHDVRQRAFEKNALRHGFAFSPRKLSPLNIDSKANSSEAEAMRLLDKSAEIHAERMRLLGLADKVVSGQLVADATQLFSRAAALDRYDDRIHTNLRIS